MEIHGSSLDVVCMTCGDRQPAEPVHDRVRAGEEDPPCLACGGILKSATISFGQSLVPEDLFRAEQAALACDLLLAVGSTLSVFPAAGMVPLAVRHGAVLVIVNGGPTEMDALADVVVAGSLSECLPALVTGLPASRAEATLLLFGGAALLLGFAARLEGEPPDAGDGPQRHGGRGHRLDHLAGTALGHGRRPYPAAPGTGCSGTRTVTWPGSASPKAMARM